MAKTESGAGGRKPDQVADPLLVAIGKRIHDVRMAKELGVTETAAAAGMQKGHLWRVEAGQHNLSVKVLARLAAALDTTMGDLLDGVPVEMD